MAATHCGRDCSPRDGGSLSTALGGGGGRALLFGLASIGAGVAQSPGELIAAPVLQGFLINVPVALVSLAAALRVVPEASEPRAVGPT